MNDIDMIATVLGVFGTVCAIIFGFLAFKRNDKTDNTTEGKKDGIMLTEIGYIKSGVDDIKRKQEKQDEQHIEVVSRLTAVEESAKQSHHRIDGHESRIEKLERSGKND